MAQCNSMGYESYNVPNTNGIIKVADLNSIFHGLELGAKLLKIYCISGSKIHKSVSI
jgi:hypothetical protein